MKRGRFYGVAIHLTRSEGRRCIASCPLIKCFVGKGYRVIRAGICPDGSGGMNEIVTRWGWLAVVVMGIALYAPSLTFSDFHFDDNEVVIENSAIHTLRHPGRFFLDPSTGRATDTDPQDHGYRPLVTLSFALNYAWSGADGRGYRAVNLAIHLATAVLTIGLCRALGLSASRAWRP